MKIGYKYTQSNIFTVSATYLCHISFQTKRLQQKKVYPQVAHEYFFIQQAAFEGWPSYCFLTSQQIFHALLARFL